ncbi:MAG TPA: flagellar hook-basal body complex protein FliE [Tepidisphaeraceae bacterium]|nr:flagellar hook-basal body complex protein FliE [Tepidisphaeraceae bacterium]
MINGLPNIGISPAGGSGAAGSPGSAGSVSGKSFADVLKSSIQEVSQMQQDATQAVNDLATGKSDDVTGVMTAVEKSDLAFNTLLAIRSKLMDAYNEIKSISV